ncbi:MAG: ABC transporter permease [Ignavibacteriaceae bacterium]|nr:ABC transporter permease [Ignavibacteriaceae bacterium]
MNLSWYIAKSFIRSRKDSRFISLISTISIIGIALGVATLVIAISVLKGFEQTITNKIIDFDSHIKITSYRATLPDYHQSLSWLESQLEFFKPEITPFASKLVIISHKKKKDGINLIGIEPTDEKPFLVKNIIEGEYRLSEDGVLIGKKLAEKLFVNVGDKITVFALRKDEIPSPENLPNIEKFVVTGIFESGMTEYDDTYAYTSLATAQSLFDIGDNITGYNIKLGDISKIDSLTIHLGKSLRYPHSVRSVYQLHRNIFTWIELQKEPIPIVLALIILVAAFNIIGTLLMIVLEKTNAVGILKTLGSKRKQIVAVFLINGAILAIAGIISGSVLAYLLMFIQEKYNVITLPSSVYFMSKVPFLITADTFLWIAIITFLLCILASIIPSLIASRIKPVNALRFS